MPASWKPERTQFPWVARQGITSDPQRQAAFQLGLGGARGKTTMRKPTGSYFDPATAFESEPPEGYTPGAALSAGLPRMKAQPRMAAKYTPATAGFGQTVPPWVRAIQSRNPMGSIRR
ncbi:MAG: hypothetical protein WBC45_05005 [Atribacterota bacterium]